MPSLRGSLVRVTASPSTAVGVLVRAPEVRAGRGGVVLTEETQVPVDRGEFTVTLEPGAAVMTVQHAGYPGEVIPLLVVEGQSTIMAAMQAASIADGAEKSEIERLLAAVTEKAHAVAEDAGKAAGAVEAVQSAKSKAVAAQRAAETAKAGAEQAKAGAESAKAGAVTARQGAESARTRAEQAKTGAESAKAGAVDAQHAAEAAKNAAQASGKPAGGWLKSDFEQAVQDTLTDVTDAVSSSASSSSGKIARYNQYRAAIYVTDPKSSTETANKRYVDGEVQSVTAQLNAAKDELAAGIAAATCITGLACTPAGNMSQFNLQTAGTATDVIAYKNNNSRLPLIVFRKTCTVLRIVLKQENYLSNKYDLPATAMERVSKGTEVNLDNMHRGLFIIWLIIGQPQD